MGQRFLSEKILERFQSKLRIYSCALPGKACQSTHFVFKSIPINSISEQFMDLAQVVKRETIPIKNEKKKFKNMQTFKFYAKLRANCEKMRK